jgi:hypothetical protein
MNYVCYELDSDPESSFTWYDHIVNYFAVKFAPNINPDFHEKYEDVVYWWLELNKEGIPLREIGFDDDGKAIVAAPLGRNKGLFTHGKPKVTGFYPVEMYQFVDQWESFVSEINSKC